MDIRGRSRAPPLHSLHVSHLFSNEMTITGTCAGGAEPRPCIVCMSNHCTRMDNGNAAVLLHSHCPFTNYYCRFGYFCCGYRCCPDYCFGCYHFYCGCFCCGYSYYYDYCYYPLRFTPLSACVYYFSDWEVYTLLSSGRGESVF